MVHDAYMATLSSIVTCCTPLCDTASAFDDQTLLQLVRLCITKGSYQAASIKRKLLGSAWSEAFNIYGRASALCMAACLLAVACYPVL